MFLHQHPYPPFIPENSVKLIVGTIPPPRFSTGDLFSDDVDFCYGSKFGLLWPILDRIFDLNLKYENTNHAILQRKNFLIQNRIGICDVIESCARGKVDASDVGMDQIKMRNLLNHIIKNKDITTLLFMGGNSKNGPEYLFRKLIKPLGLELINKSAGRPKIHELHLEGRKIKTISLISPSSAANRSIGGDPYYKMQKKANKNYTTLDFRVEQFRNHFT
ncbi:uracil-DNA glycosylase family protein [Lutimonas halocynthiae]|uniref:uracil-DNA glycosylase family protein n=1 Tax=Lutimonas halocynthiae TaxID=1446477 RepID=UPI0025B60464|nr:uracil-DNA glycosylase family protein [Lutimonas halocynthiae]MDN3642101.1 uracil-DNA glycosylase family protein [Lutimonas halocynthiae]